MQVFITYRELKIHKFRGATVHIKTSNTYYRTCDRILFRVVNIRDGQDF